MTVPEKMKAVVVQSDKTVAVKEVPTPTIGENDILVRNVAAAQNPTDWQYVDNVTNVGTILGTDWAGYVVAKGPLVTQWKVGDKAAGFTHGGTYKDRGAYAEYVKADAELAWKIPNGSISFEEAATLGCAFWTAAQGLFNPTRLGLLGPPAKAHKPETLFVYSGSSSVGMYATQLATLAGYKVIAVASPKNHELCKSLGAHAVFDYHDPESIEKIQHFADNSIHYGFDTIGGPETQSYSVKCMGPGESKIVTIKPADNDAQALRSDVKIQATLIYTALGLPFSLWEDFPEIPEDKAHMASFLKIVPELVQDGKVKPNPIKLWEGGLEGVSDGLQYMREGKHSAEKIVHRVSSD